MMDADTFEKFTRLKGLTPADKIELPEAVIYLADGYRHDKPAEYPWGYYETAWATARDGVDVAQCLEFDAFHDPAYPTKEEKQKLRLRAATKEAVKWAGLNVEVGRYD